MLLATVITISVADAIQELMVGIDVSLSYQSDLDTYPQIYPGIYLCRKEYEYPARIYFNFASIDWIESII